MVSCMPQLHPQTAYVKCNTFTAHHTGHRRNVSQSDTPSHSAGDIAAPKTYNYPYIQLAAHAYNTVRKPAAQQTARCKLEHLPTDQTAGK